MVMDNLSIVAEEMKIEFLTHKRSILIAVSGGYGELNPVTQIYEKPTSEGYCEKTSEIVKKYGFNPLIAKTFRKALSLLDERDDILAVITCSWLDDAPLNCDPKGKILTTLAMEKGIPSVVVCHDGIGGTDLLFPRKCGFNKEKTILFHPERTSLWHSALMALLRRGL